jgi:mono/diheme cytochrome c family protein
MTNRHILLALGAFAASMACRPRADARAPRDFERMRSQQRYNAYGPSGFFANGAVLQAPPAHTVSRPPAYAAEPRPLAIEAGGRQYEIFCAPCHGAGGFGGGPVAANLSSRRPSSLRSATVAALSDSTLFGVVTNGFGQMPPHGWQLPPADRWAVVGYVRTLASRAATPATRADSEQAAALHALDSLHAIRAPLDSLMARSRRQR